MLKCIPREKRKKAPQLRLRKAVDNSDTLNEKLAKSTPSPLSSFLAVGIVLALPRRGYLFVA